MKKVIIQAIDGYNYKLRENNREYIKNIEFISSYKPKVNDIIYLSEYILNEENLFTFKEITNQDEIKESEIIKIIADKYYLKRIYG